MAYDAASRVKQVANWDATINLEYFDDNLLKSHQELTGSNYNHTNIYAYDADGNRQSLTYPFGSLFQYNYTGRNQLGSIANAGSVALVTYQYDRVGNRLQRSLYNGTVTDYAAVDALNRSSWVKHSFNGTEKARFDYAFDEVSRLKYEQRDSSTADGYGYDGAGQLTGFNREGTLSSSGIVSGGIDVATLGYDAAGNRAQVTSNGTTTTWSVNDLNEYTSANGVSASSDVKGNLQSYNGWTYTYDAQNRLTNATDGATSVEFWYDGLNRQITRRINGSIIIRSVWDGWNLIEEHDQNDSPLEYYIHGARADELVVRFGGVYGDTWYAQDGRGNTSHLFDYGGIVERYTYGLAGEPKIFDGNNYPRTQSALANRFMFQGRDYLKEGAIYDYRNRFYLPSLGRFIQPDPLGFGGDAANLYRYCGGDPVNGSDPLGLETLKPDAQKRVDGNTDEATTERVTVEGQVPHDFVPRDNGFTDVTPRNGGLDFLNQGSGLQENSRFPRITVSRNSNGLGITRANVPKNTQGWWTDPEGFPTGTSWSISDGQITEQLQSLYMRKLRGVDVASMSADDYIKLMEHLDTAFFDFANTQFFNVGGFYGQAGLYYGGEINYIGVGEGFAARGVSLFDMKGSIVAWKAWNSSNSSGTVRGSEFHWATVGYFAYPFYRSYFH